LEKVSILGKVLRYGLPFLIAATALVYGLGDH